MSRVNVPKDNDDPAYRYWRPVVKTAPKKNKLQILNTNEIAKAIYKTPQNIAQFIKVDKSEAVSLEDGLITFNTQSKNALEIDDLIEKFIIKKVLCKKCGLPQTEYQVEKGKGVVYCACCGYTEQLKSTDKYDAFLLK